ncbi:MAG: DUF177 domain-containing protein [Oscillospiraceae bacterium]|nr:DUF177 domain-containing protein [Oscillospiraceae bacterium]
MLLNLSKIVGCPGMVPFETALDLSDLSFGDCHPARVPVLAKGTVRNSAGVLLLRGTVETTLHGVCDRCLKPFERFVSYPLEAVLVKELENEKDENEWVFLLQNDCADLTDIIRTTFVLNMDSRLLCREDCKGLCFRCGKDLNDGPCDCQPEADPRLAVLQKLLTGKNP